LGQTSKFLAKNFFDLAQAHMFCSSGKPGFAPFIPWITQIDLWKNEQVKQNLKVVAAPVVS